MVATTKRMKRLIRLGIAACALSAASPAVAQRPPIEYDATTAWWSRQTRIIETGGAAVGFALPVLKNDRMVGAITIACPKQSERGPFVDIPKAVYPLGQFEGKEVGTILAINGEAFAGFIDRDRRLVYLNAPPLPQVPGMKIGTSVRAALAAAKGTLHISTDPMSHSGIIINPTRAETSSAAAAELIRHLRDQGLSPLSLGQAIRICDAFVQEKK